MAVAGVLGLPGSTPSAAMRIFGGCSDSVDFDVERYHRDSSLLCIGEGTNEMQRIIIARQLVERNPA